MKCIRILLAAAFLAAALMPAFAQSMSTGTVVDGNARFTVVTPNCIRMEYSNTGGFIDDPSYFAANRQVRDSKISVFRSGKSVAINTGAIRLTYVDDGKPFDDDNLKATIDRTIAWTPSMKNDRNLGGAIRTLDGYDGPAPLDDGVLSRNGWYVLDDSRGVLIENGWAKERPAGETDWYLFGYGTDFHAALKSMTAISGDVPLPRRYILGAWYSRYWPYSSTDYRQIVKEYADHGFPLDNIVMDMDWHEDGWTGWSWNRKLLPDAEDLLQWFHAQGLHVTLNMHPADGVKPHETQYAVFMRDLGKDPSTRATVPFDPANRPYMNALFDDVIDPLENDGVDFWWLDWQQSQYTPGIPDLTNLAWLNELLYDHSADGGKRGASFSRWGGWGDQRHPIHFSGDASTHWRMLQFEIAMTAASGNSGCFFWTHDIGGHMGGRNEESYMRWCQFGALSAALRCHSTRDATMDRRPWTYPAWAEESMRRSWRLRSVLFPYIYTSAAESSRESVPLLRPIYFDYPSTEAAYHNAQEYLFGDNLLVAPIATPGVGPGHVSTQTVWFPSDSDWYDWFTGVRYCGDSDNLVSEDSNELPLYVRGGVPIPLQPYTPRMGTSPIKTLDIRVFPGTAGRSSLYEDDGLSTAYRSGAFATTSMTYSRHGDASVIRIDGTKGHFAGQLTQRMYVVEFAGLRKAKRAVVDGRAVAVDYDPALGIDRIRVPARPIGRPVVVTVIADELPQSTLVDAAQMRRVRDIVGDTWGLSMRQILTDPRMTGLDDPQVDALLAVDGVGLVDHNDGVYLYHGNHRLKLYGAPTDSHLVRITRTADGSARLTNASSPPISAGSLEMDDFDQIAWADIPIAGRTYTLRSSPLVDGRNVALTATVTASSSQPGYSPYGAVDGRVDGYPTDTSAEWASNYEKAGAWIKLSWDTPQTIDRIVLYDRPNLGDQVQGGKLTFDDGTSIDVGGLPNDASTGLEVKFAPKTVKSVTFTVTSAKPSTVSIGLSEIAAYREQ